MNIHGYPLIRGVSKHGYPCGYVAEDGGEYLSMGWGTWAYPPSLPCAIDTPSQERIGT